MKSRKYPSLQNKYRFGFRHYVTVWFGRDDAGIKIKGGKTMGLLYDREFTDLEKSQMLTTGQMVDTLKRGKTAECVTGFYEGSKVLRTDIDEIIFTDSKEFLKMTTFAHDSKWILQK